MQGYSNTAENCDRPKCAACEFAKGFCLSNKVHITNNNNTKNKDIKKDQLQPVHIVFAYHYILRDPGRLYHTKGKSDPSEMFSEAVFLLTMLVFMWASITKWI